MRGYVARRAAQMLFVVFGVVTATFFAVRLVPGDPARIMNRPGTPESVLKLTREQLGTDKPCRAVRPLSRGPVAG
jgi:ABC-type dipeptide/oligopeptide/nickel transport system permease component